MILNSIHKVVGLYRLILEHCLLEFWLNLVHIPHVPVQVSCTVELPLTDIALQLWSSMAGTHVVRYVGTPAEPEDFLCILHSVQILRI